MTSFVAVANRTSLEKTLPWLIGITLGAAAFAVDELPWLARTLFVPLLSSGFSWGLAALAAGYFAFRPVLILLLGTFFNYALLVVIGQPWQNNFTEDGSSVAPAMFESIARSLVFWLVASVAAGLLMGWLGRAIRHGSAKDRSAAAGVALGLLSGQSVSSLIYLTYIWAGVNSTIVTGLIAASLGLILAMIAVTWMWVSRPSRSWPWFLGCAFASTILSAAAWTALEPIRHSL